MSIVAADIKTRYSIPSATVGFTDAQPDPNDSLGKFMATTEWVGGVLHDLFAPLSAQQNLDSDVHYRCIFIHNTHGTLVWTTVKAWIHSEVAGGAAISFGVDPAGAVVESLTPAVQSAVIATEEDVPAGVAFVAPTTEGTALVLGDIGPGECIALWIRRTAANTPAVANDGGVLRFRGETL